MRGSDYILYGLNYLAGPMRSYVPSVWAQSHDPGPDKVIPGTGAPAGTPEPPYFEQFSPMRVSSRPKPLGIDEHEEPEWSDEDLDPIPEPGLPYSRFAYNPLRGFKPVT